MFNRILCAPSKDSAWMVHSGYHPLKHRPLRIVLGWCTVDHILCAHRPILRTMFKWMISTCTSSKGYPKRTMFNQDLRISTVHHKHILLNIVLLRG